MHEEVRCPECGRTAASGERFCRGCGGDLSLAPPPVAAGLPREARAVSGWRDSRLYVALFLILAFAFFFHVRMPGSEADKRKEAEERKRVCVANMRRIHAAVERYMAERFGGNADLKTLTHEGYLPDEPRCPADGRYTIRISAPSPDGKVGITVGVRCSIHQSADRDSGL